MSNCHTTSIPIEICIDTFRKTVKNADLVIDCRTAEEFEEGHLEGAILLPLQHLSIQAEALKDHSQKSIYIYCRTGNRSATFARYLRTIGCLQSQSIEGGFETWGASSSC